MDFDNYIENERIRTDLQERKVVHTCDNCGAEIYVGNEFWSLEGYNLCEDCFDEIQKNEKNEHRLIAGDELWED